jgi:hypothetical protein
MSFISPKQRRPLLRSFAAVLTAATLLSCSLTTQACTSAEYQSCLLGVCICLTKDDGGLGELAEQVDLQTLSQQASAVVLEQWINHSYRTSYPTALPLPTAIHTALANYFDQDLLAAVRYQVAGEDMQNLAELTMSYGDQVSGLETQAMTLVDLVVFRKEEDALHNLELWAHELAHVQQYRTWGVSEFARRYVGNPQLVEGEANAVERGFAANNKKNANAE